MANLFRIKMLSAEEPSSLEALEGTVNEWVKTRERSVVTGIQILGNVTKGYTACVTYRIVPRSATESEIDPE